MADKNVYHNVYHEWKIQAEQVRKIASDKTLALWERAHMVGRPLTAIELNGLQSKHRQKIMATIVQVNRILANYQLDTFDDYQKISNDELHEIIRLFKTLTPPR